MPIPSAHVRQLTKLLCQNDRSLNRMRSVAVGVLFILVLASCSSAKRKQPAAQLAGQVQHQVVGPRQKLSFNPAWRFIKEDVPAARDPGFDDSSWSTVSCPHTYNDIDTFDDLSPGDHV